MGAGGTGVAVKHHTPIQGQEKIGWDGIASPPSEQSF